MLLRRITKHIQEQNWFAVGVDFFIVVVGVFVGLQVQQWSAQRADRALEQEYIARMHSEVEDLASENRAFFNLKTEQERYQALSEVAPDLAGEATPTEMTPDHCAALVRSHIYFNEVVQAPTIVELMSSGRIFLLSDQRLRTAIIQYTQSSARSSGILGNLRQDRRVLQRVHPQLIAMNPEDLWGSSAVCDWHAMRSSALFINDFTDNLSRYRAYSELILAPQHEAQRELHAELDRVLGITHEGVETP